MEVSFGPRYRIVHDDTMSRGEGVIHFESMAFVTLAGFQEWRSPRLISVKLENF